MIILAVIVTIAVLFFSLFSIILIPREVNKPLKIPGETYFLVKKPGPFERVFINVGDELNAVVWGSIFSIFTGRVGEIPWYMDRDYISANAFFCYNTKHGIIIDREFFNP